LAVRTTTALWMSPFFTRPRGIASFTETMMMSPTDALRRRVPPRTRMHCTRRAPELSATSRLVSCCIIPERPFDGSGFADPADDFPTLALRERARFLDANHVAHLERVGLVVRQELLRPGHELFVDRVHDPPVHTDRHGLVGLVADHDTLHYPLRHSLIAPRPPLSGARRESS